MVNCTRPKSAGVKAKAPNVSRGMGANGCGVRTQGSSKDRQSLPILISRFGASHAGLPICAAPEYAQRAIATIALGSPESLLVNSFECCLLRVTHAAKCLVLAR